jgi:hypothetical protein
MLAYSFFLQGQSLPKNRTQHDLTVLRNSVLTSGDDIYQQLTVNVEVVDGLSAQMRSSPKRLQVACTLSSHENLVDLGQEWLDERQAEAEVLIRLFLEQVTNDFNAFRLEKEKLILLAHLSQQQSIEVLQLNMKLADIMEKSQVQIEQSIGKQIDENTSKMKRNFKDILDQNRLLFATPCVKLITDSITTYDVKQSYSRKRSRSKTLLPRMHYSSLKTSNCECICHSCHRVSRPRGTTSDKRPPAVSQPTTRTASHYPRD